MINELKKNKKKQHFKNFNSVRYFVEKTANEGRGKKLYTKTGEKKSHLND